MNQGKIMNISLLRQICLSILSGKSLNEVKNQLKVARSTVIRHKKSLKLAGITSTEALVSLSDKELAKVIYGKNADIYCKTSKSAISIRKEVPNHVLKNLYEADFASYARRYAENHNLKKADIYIDYVNEAKSMGKEYLKTTAFRNRLNKEIGLLKGPDVTMHREHAYGDELQLDWCGDNFKIKGPQNQELKYSVMVLTWAASCYVYAIFVPDQTTKSTIEGLKSAFTYFDCLPNQLVIDNAKQMVTKHKIGREAIFNPSFDLFMRKCGVPVNANNPRRPNEKTQVEQAVNLVQSRCLTRMRGKFLLLDEANIMLTNFVEEYINKAPFRGKKDTPRLSLYNTYEKPAARKIERALPSYIEHMPNLVVNKDYHVKIHNNFYSVPYLYAGKTVDASIEGGIVKIYFNRELIESHVYRKTKGVYVTKESNMPIQHKVIHEKNLKYPTPDAIYSAAASMSNELLSFCKAMLGNNENFQEKKKGCIYMLNLYRRHPKERLIFNRTIQSILHDVNIRHINSYEFDKALKDMKTYMKTHDGELPHQLELDFFSNENLSVGDSDTTAFLRSTDEILKKQIQKSALNSIKTKDDDLQD